MMDRIFKILLDFFRSLWNGRSLPETIEEDLPPEDSATVPPPVMVDSKPTITLPVEVKPEIETRPVLSRGSSQKEFVVELQKALYLNGEQMNIDGQFGPNTEAAVKRFQASYGLGESGVVDELTWQVLDRRMFSQDPTFKAMSLPALTPVEGTTAVAKAWNSYGNLLTTLAEILGLPASVACAVLAVESAGAGFWQGRMVIRFENHVFRSRWGRSNASVFEQHFRTDAKESWKGHAWRPDNGAWRLLHTSAAGQGEEYAVLAFARSLAEEPALQSISMGAPQIMGFNHALIGYASARAMFDAFAEDEKAHILGLFDFFRSNHMMVRALRTGDWEGFARIYNGSGQAAYYGGKIGENVEAAKRLEIG